MTGEGRRGMIQKRKTKQLDESDEETKQTIIENPKELKTAGQQDGVTIQVKQRSGSVFRGYFENDGEDSSPDVFRKQSNAKKRDHYPVLY